MCDLVICFYCVFFFKQKTAYEMRISDWSSDGCSSDLEGAESYAKDLGQRYSPVRLMCSHPNGETWASRSGSIWVPLAARVLTTSPSFMVFQNMMMAASRFIPAMR